MTHRSSCFRTLLVGLCMGAALVATPACSKKTSSSDAVNAITAESIEEAPESVTEEHDNGTVTWAVGADGQVKALAKNKEDKPITKDISGEMTFKTAEGEKTVPVTVDENTGLLTASGPKLDDDINEVSYKLKIDGRPWTGTMHLPKGGTQELVENARVAAENPPPKDAKGPNGGVVQTVGKDKIEIVTAKGSSEVRVYVLDDELKPVEVGERKVKLAIATEKGSDVVVLAPEPKGMYFTGTVSVKEEPVRVTAAVTVHEHTHVCVVGWAPHTHIIVGSHRPHVWVAGGWWGPGVHVNVGGPTVIIHDDPGYHIKVKGRHKIKGRGHGGIKIHIH